MLSERVSFRLPTIIKGNPLKARKGQRGIKGRRSHTGDIQETGAAAEGGSRKFKVRIAGTTLSEGSDLLDADRGCVSAL